MLVQCFTSCIVFGRNPLFEVFLLCYFFTEYFIGCNNYMIRYNDTFFVFTIITHLTCFFNGILRKIRLLLKIRHTAM